MKRRTILLTLAAIALIALVGAVPLVQADDPPSPGPEPGPGIGNGVFLVGKVTQVEGDQVLIETADGDWTVLVDEDTQIRLPGVEEATVEDIEVDKLLMVKGQVTGVGTMQAALISPPPGQRRLAERFLRTLQQARRLQGALKGQVIEVGEEQFTMQAGENEIQAGENEIVVPVDDETVYRVPDIEEPTLDDIAPEQFVVVGLPKEEGAAAKAVAVVTERRMRRITTEQQLLRRTQRIVCPLGIRGEVVSIEETAPEEFTLILSTPRGEVTVKVNEETRFHIPDTEEASLSDIAEGDVIIVVGRPDISCPINAQHIKVMPERPENEQ